MRRKVLVLAAGVNGIESGVELDRCAIDAVDEARALGWDTLLLSDSLATVSTAHGLCDRVIVDAISLESILAICAAERPDGVMLSMGGARASTLAIALHRAGIRVLGTPAVAVNIAERRDKFAELLATLRIDQPAGAAVGDMADLPRRVAALGGYPVQVRPSYAATGAATCVVWSEDALRGAVADALRVSPDYPVVISKFEEGALEIELDAVAWDGELLVWAASEQADAAGLRAGDATLVFPALSLEPAIVAQVRQIGHILSRALRISGPFNVRLHLVRGALQVIACNLRASRSMPFVSTAIGVNFAREATRAMLGAPPSKELIDAPCAPRTIAAFGHTRFAAQLKAMLGARDEPYQYLPSTAGTEIDSDSLRMFLVARRDPVELRASLPRSPNGHVHSSADARSESFAPGFRKPMRDGRPA